MGRIKTWKIALLRARFLWREEKKIITRMKTLIYFENADGLKRSGIGRAMAHQLQACKDAGVETTIDKKDAFDIAHINTYFGKSRRTLRRVHKKGVPVIVHGHSTYEDFRNSFRLWKMIEPFFDSWLTYMYKRADMIIAPTPYARDLIKGYGLCQNVIAISNGIDIPAYGETKEGQKAFRERFGVKEGEKFVMGVGFPFQRKGLPDFIEVARRFPDTKFIWFGFLQRILTQPKILKAIKHKPDNVIMAGYCSGDLIKGAYQTASAMFFPSYEETEGIVVLEALACKCPLLLRDIGVYKPWLERGVHCRMASDNDGFEKELRDLLENGEKPEVLEAGYQVALERDLPKVGEQLKQAYETLLKKE